MFDLNLTLQQHEAEVLAESVKNSMNTSVDYFPNADYKEFPDIAFELSVLAKLYNVLPKKEKVDPATNDDDQFENTY